MTLKNKPSAATQAKTKLLVVDDHPMMRLGHVEALNREPDFIVCGQAGTACEAMEAIARLKPDLVVIDITLGRRSGPGQPRPLPRRPPCPASAPR